MDKASSHAVRIAVYAPECPQTAQIAIRNEIYCRQETKRPGMLESFFRANDKTRTLPALAESINERPK
jgi:hypothetical protein